jgi:hypothetical protein
LAGPDRGDFRRRDGMMDREWGPRRSERGMMDMEHPGGQRL